jgi:CheY-like chemotaxis protein/nitrogen-specific signal transduction histidine kinase
MTRILIVDDEPVARQTLADLLAGDAFDLDFAADGRAGLAAARAILPDIILLDLMMPGMDGYEVCTQLRADPLLAEIPILMITAYDDRKSRLRGIGAGADDFIAKPFDGIELLTRLRTIARLNRFRRLNAERTRFKWVIERAADGYLILDLAGRLSYINAPARLFLGLDPGDVLPTESVVPILKHTYRLEPQAAWAHWPAAPLGERCYLVRPETPTAPAFWLQVSEQRLTSGDEGQIVLNLQDATELVTTRTDMRSFRTVLAHKLRTPLNAVLATLELLLDMQDELSADEVRDFISDAVGGARRLHAAVDDVLSYAEGAAAPHAGAAFALAELPATVAGVVDMLHLSNVTLALDATAQFARIPLARGAVEQILFELLENSQKFHPDQTPIVAVTVAQVADIVHITVIDNGITLSPQQIQWALTPYLQGEKFFTGEIPGMGLGLPLVAALLWQVGGEIRVNNRTDAPGVSVELLIPVIAPNGGAVGAG